MSKARKVVLGHVYSVAVGGSYLPVLADKVLGHGRYEGTVLRPGGKDQTIKFSTDRVRGEGRPEDEWRKAQEAGRQERESQALQTAAKVASKVLGIPVGVVPACASHADRPPKAKAAGDLPAGQAGPKPRKKAERKDGTMSGLDAAAKVLADAGEPLNSRTIVERAIEKGYWKTGGKTPAATVYAAILREIQKKGDASRFAKADRGMFTLKA
jgi:hypothetical protein